MSFRVAVASSDGKVINQHFGRSRQFLIFEISDNEDYKFLEKRENNPPCGLGEHHDDEMQRSVDLISDCRYVLISQIGPGADQALKAKGIQSYSIGDFIDNALTKLISFEKKKKKL